MKKGLWCFATVVALYCLFCCTHQQRQRFKEAAPKVLSQIAYAFGGPYSNIVQSFFQIAGGLGESGGLYAGNSPQEYETGGQGDSFEQSEEEPYPDWPEGEVEQPVDARDEYYSDWEMEEPTPVAEASWSEQQEDIHQGDANWPGSQTMSPQPQLQIEMDLVREVYQHGQYYAETIKNGDTLTRSDQYKITFQSNEPCYVYIVQLDSTGKMDPVFPSKFHKAGNPVEPYTFFSIPEGNYWFFLDENQGVETIYFVASLTRRTDLERVLRELELQNQNLVQRTPISLDSSVVITRGIGGVRPGNNQSVSLKSGGQGSYTSTLFNSIEDAVVITRWFNHK